MVDRIYGLVGRTLAHSWSVEIHELLGCAGYRLIELEPDELQTFIERDDIGGLNVTIPYKIDVLASCDGVSETAHQIGSVNTLKRREDGTLYGDNTDRAGFIYAARLAGLEFADAKVLILGSGGTSKTAVSAARLLGARELIVISRRGKDNYDNLQRHADADIVVNTTPVGMFPRTDASPVDLSTFPACRGVFDVIYNPRRTRFLAQAAEKGIPHTGGLPMLVAQAVASEEVFFDKKFSEDAVRDVVAEIARMHEAE